jgi:hypothetical protein
MRGKLARTPEPLLIRQAGEETPGVLPGEFDPVDRSCQAQIRSHEMYSNDSRCMMAYGKFAAAVIRRAG